MSNPSSGFAVRVEHLPDRRYRLWLQLPDGPLDLGVSGYVVLYAQGGFHLDTPEGMGSYAPAEIDFDPPAEAMTYPGRRRE